MIAPRDLERLRRAVDALPEDRRRVYILIAKEGLGYAAVAETMGLATRQVEHLLAEALVDLVHALDQE